MAFAGRNKVRHLEHRIAGMREHREYFNRGE